MVVWINTGASLLSRCLFNAFEHQEKRNPHTNWRGDAERGLRNIAKNNDWISIIETLEKKDLAQQLARHDIGLLPMPDSPFGGWQALSSEVNTSRLACWYTELHMQETNYLVARSNGLNSSNGQFFMMHVSLGLIHSVMLMFPN